MSDSSKTVPADLVQLTRYGLRYRKLLWIAGIPLVIVSLFFFDSGPAPRPGYPTTAPTPLWIGVLWLVAGLACCVVAASRRRPARDLGVRLMLDRPQVVDRILVCDTTGSRTLEAGLLGWGITQIVFFGGAKALTFIEIEDPRNVAAALDAISAHLPGVPYDYEIADDHEWADKSVMTTLIRRF